MRVENLSLKTITVGTLLVLGVLPVALILQAEGQFREAALGSKVKSLSRVIEVATEGVMQELHGRLLDFSASLQERTDLKGGFAALERSGDRGPLQTALDDPFLKGFVGAGEIDLVALRLYDLDLAPLVQRSRDPGPPFRLAPSMLRRVEGRSGVDALKAIGGLWSLGDRALYSVLVPVGGLRAVGYLEVVANPAFNLSAVAERVHMPVALFGRRGEALSNPAPSVSGSGFLPIEYTLHDIGGEPALRVVGHEDVKELDADMRNTQLTITGAYILVAFAILALALWVFNRFVLAPVNRMLNVISKCSDVEVVPQIDTRALKEFHLLADAFNCMTRRLRASVQELQRLSSQDGLTGVANRREFDDVLRREWRRAGRNGGLLGLLLVDIDAFKRYNDTYGHQAGDNCLQAVASALGRAVRRPGDLVARYGGEEFGLILPETTLAGALDVAERVRSSISQLGIMHSASATARVVTVSVGVAVACPGTGEPKDLVRMADEELYRAKREGRNRVAHGSLQDGELLTS